MGVGTGMAIILASQPQVREEGPKSPRGGPGTWAPNPGGAVGATARPGDRGMFRPGGW